MWNSITSSSDVNRDTIVLDADSQRPLPMNVGPYSCAMFLKWQIFSPKYTSFQFLYSSSRFRSWSSTTLSARVTKRTMGSLPRTPLFEAISSHDAQSSAVVHCLSGRSFTYGHLVKDVAAAKERIAKDAGKDVKSMAGQRIAFLVENAYDYVGA